MIELSFTYEEVKATNTYEMTCVATGGSPFVKDSDDVFLNIATPSDMALLPDTPGGGLYRSDTITMIFRDDTTRQFTVNNIEEQIGQLNTITLADINGATLYSNVP